MKARTFRQAKKAAVALAWFLCCGAAWAQSLVSISDTLKNADGTNANGRLVVSWDPFTTAAGVTVDGGSLTYTISNGVINLALAPSVGASPAGTSYRVRYYLANGASYQETWVVPSSGPVTIAQVRALQVPAPISTVNVSQVVGGAPGKCAQYDAGGVLASAAAPCGSGGGGGGGYATVQEEGGNLTQRGTLNFVGSGVSAADNAGQARTDVSLDADLNALADLATTGLVARTGAAAYTARTITGDSEITVANGNGVAGNPTLALAASLTRDSEINVQGTANEITSSGSGPTPTLSIASALNLGTKELQGASPLVFEGATADNFETTVAVTDPTADRTFTIPDANSVAVQPATCSGTDKVSAISASGVITCSADQAGGGSNHNLLSATHSDTTVGTVARGDLIVGQSATPTWQRLAIGAANSFLGSNGTDATWTAPSGGGAVLGTGRTLTAGLGIAALGDLSANRTVAFDYGQTLAGNPALNVKECIFTNEGGSGGLLCEGTTADSNEQEYLIPASNGADTTNYFALGNSSGVATAALALNTNPANCASGFAAGVDATGAAEGCGTNIATATALAANGSNCSAGSYPLGVDASGASESCTDYGSETKTFTNKTIDGEGTGNTITLPFKIFYRVAVCQGTTASLAVSTPSSNAATAVCQTGTNTQQAQARFDQATSQSIQDHFTLPSDWTGAIDLSGKWKGATGSTNNVLWRIYTACVADAETGDPTFNTAQTITDAGKATANQQNDFSLTNLTTTGCAAGEEFYWKFDRDAANASDTYADNADLIELTFTIRRAM